MAIIGAIQESKNKQILVKIRPHKEDPNFTLTLGNDDVLFTVKPEDYYDGLVEAGIIDAATADQKKSKVPEFVKLFITGVGKNKK